MKILFLHSSSDLYGAGKILLVSVHTLKKNGYTPIVVLSSPGPLADALQDKGIEVRFIPLGILRRKYYSIPGIINRIITFRKAVKKLTSLVTIENIQLIYSNTTAVLVGARVANKTAKKHIWHVHEIIEKPKWLFNIIAYCLNHYCDRMIVVSDAVALHWQKKVTAEKIIRIYNGIDYSAYLQTDTDSIALRKELLPTHKKILIGMIGRVHHWKGQDYFLEIAKHLKDYRQDIHFVMVGDAFPGNEYLYDKINELKQTYQLEKDVTDLGYRTDIAALLKCFDLFILPSTAPDPFPTVLLEAMASSTAVAATSHGGAVEMIRPHQDGLLIPYDDAASAAAQIQEILSNEALLQQMGESARERVIHTFSFETYSQRLGSVIKEMTS